MNINTVLLGNRLAAQVPEQWMTSIPLHAALFVAARDNDPNQSVWRVLLKQVDWVRHASHFLTKFHSSIPSEDIKESLINQCTVLSVTSNTREFSITEVANTVSSTLWLPVSPDDVYQVLIARGWLHPSGRSRPIYDRYIQRRNLLDADHRESVLTRAGYVELTAFMIVNKEAYYGRY